MSLQSGAVFPSNPNALAELQSELKKYLYQDAHPLLLQLFDDIEKKANLKRENLIYGIVGLLSLYLVVGSAAELLCNMIGFGYPAYESVKAVRTANKSDDMQWLIYWTVFASFSFPDFFADSIMSVVPLYWLAKAVFLLYLALPQTRGAELIFFAYVEPIYSRLEALILGCLMVTAEKASASTRTAVAPN